MKGLKKIVFVMVVVVVFFVVYVDLKVMDDSVMGNIIGQVGVIIELEIKVSIGQFKYIDEGFFVVNDIVFGGVGVMVDGVVVGYNDLLDQLIIEIDVEDDGDVFIQVGMLDGNLIDWGMIVGFMELLVGGIGFDSIMLIFNMSGYGNLVQLDICVDIVIDCL